MRWLPALFLMLFGFTGAGQAAEVPQWVIDKEVSRITFSATQSGQSFSGTLPAFDGTISFSPDNLANSKVEITLPLEGISTNSTTRDEELPKPTWLSLAQFPKAFFNAQTFRLKADGTYEAEGTLTLKGTTLPLTLPFSLTISEGRAHMQSTFALDRSAYNVGEGWRDGDVSNRIDVKVDLTASLLVHAAQASAKD